MEKVIIFTHESDIDGIGCVILAKMAFSNLDYVLLHNVEDLEINFRNYLESGKFDNYDQIFVTDLALYNPSLSMVNADENLRNKLRVFDHHKRAIDSGCGMYSFTKIMEVDENGKARCGTDLFYEYLWKNKLIEKTDIVSTFVELTRLEDNWDWKDKGSIGITAHDLAILFNIVGKEEYISRMISKLSSKNETIFVLNEEEQKIVEDRKIEYNKLLSDILKQAEYFTDENGNNYCVVFSKYEYRNELPEFIRNSNNPHNIKYILVVALDKGEYGQKSYRSIDKTFDVNSVAMQHGGGGHPGAAAVNISKEQRIKADTLPKKEALKYLADCKYTK